MKKHFDLQKVQFTQESEDQGNMFSSELIEMYNKDYSLLVNETKNFFADCKDFLSRFITLNNMGIGFNLPFMLTTVIKMEDEILSPRRKNKIQAQSLKQRKQRLQGSFINLLEKMGQVIEQMLNFELKIKKTYLGQAFATPYKPKSRINQNMIRNRNTSVSTAKKSQSHSKKIGDTPQQENILRQMLKKGMNPFNQNEAIVCSINLSPEENIQKLSDKIGNLKLRIESSKTKQQKIWKIFNQKRPSRNMFEQQTPNIEAEQDKQFKKINNMLSDIISQKNRFYLSPYETVQSSFL